MNDAPRLDPPALRSPVLALALLLGACGAGAPDAPEKVAGGADERTASLVDDPFTTEGDEGNSTAATPPPSSAVTPDEAADSSAAIEGDAEREDVRIAAAEPSRPEDAQLSAANPPTLGAASDPDTDAAPDPDERAVPTPDPDNDAPGDAVPAEVANSPVSPPPEPAPEPAFLAVIDTASTAETDVSRTFVSTTTPGFTGELLDDGTVRVAWPAEADARGYNVYRQAEYVTTVHDPEFIDKDIFDRDYYYEVHAFDGASPSRFSTIGTGLTVRVRGLGRPDPDAKRSNEDMLDGYDLVFADEFDTGVLDASKWNTSFLWGPDIVINSEEQYYVDALRDPDFGFDPFTFENGALVINSIRTPPALLDKANGQPYLSGMITSYDAFKFTYGYVEARARVPYGKGYWPAFWLLNAYYVDDEPEIDIMEFIGDDQDVVYHTYHYYDADGTLRSTESEPTPGVDYTADFHTYAVDWRPGLIVYYIDGIEVHRISDARVSRQDMYVIANTAIGGWWAGSPDQSTPFPGRYELDYIRVYRQTRPYAAAPLSDGESRVEPASMVPGASPAHRPPFDLWPQGYPGRG